MQHRKPILSEKEHHEIRWLAFGRYGRIFDRLWMSGSVPMAEAIQYVGAVELYEEMLWRLGASLSENRPPSPLDYHIPYYSRLLALN